MNGYEKRTTIKKTAIVDAARALFFTRGIQNVSIKEIAALARVSQVSIYNYFGDKNTLAKAAFVSIIEDTMTEFDQILKSDLPFDEKLNIIMRHKGDLADKILRSHFDEQAWNDKELRQIFGEAVKERATVLYRNFIELGKDEGKINHMIPTDAALHYMTMSLELFQRPEFLGTDTAYKVGMMKLFLYGLIGKEDVDKWRAL